MIGIRILLLSLVVLAFRALPALADAADQARASGVLGGLAVHLGCGDGRLTTALCAGDGYLVHGLDADDNNVDLARSQVQASGLCGQVTVDWLEGRQLPYVDNLVNLLVMRDAGHGVRDEEIRRVLAPGGVALKLNPKTRNLKLETRNPKPET